MRSFKIFQIILILSLTACSSTYEKPVVSESVLVKKEINRVKKNISISSPWTLHEALEILKTIDINKNEEARELYLVAYKILELAYPLSLKVEDALSEINEGFYNELFKEVSAGNYVQLKSEEVSYISNLIVSLAILNSNDQKTLDRCEAILETLVKLNNLSVLPYYLLGRVLEKNGMPNEAINYYDRAILIDPSAYVADIAKARLFLDQEKPAQALILLDYLDSVYPDSAELMRLRASAFLKQRKFDIALNVVREAMKLFPDDFDLSLLNLNILEKIGDAQTVSLLIDEFEENKKSDEIMLLRSKLKYDTGNFNEALEILEQAISSFPENIDLQEFYGVVLLKVDDEEKALTILEEINLKQPNRYKTIEILMKYYYDKELWTKAVFYLEPLLVLENSLEYYEYAYKIYLKLNNYTMAFLFAKTIYENNTDNYFHALNYIETLIFSGNKDKASKLINKIVKDIDDSEQKSQLIYFKSIISNNISEKILFLNEAIYENPLNPDAMKALADIMYKEKDFDRAYFLFKQLKMILPFDQNIDIKIKKLKTLLKIEN